MKIKNLTVFSLAIVLFFSFFLISNGQEEFIPGIQEQTQKTSAEIIKKEEEKKKNTIESIDCPNGSVRYFELEEKWWQKLDKVFFDYSLGDASKIIGCGISPISISKDPDGKVTTAQCPGTSVQYYNSKGEFKICLVPPTKVTRAGDVSKPPDISGEIQLYNLVVNLPCNPAIGGEACSKTKTPSPAEYVARLYVFGLTVAGLLAFGAIVYGSIKYIVSAGNTSSQEDAKGQIYQAILGLVLLLGASIILYTINPKLVTLTNPQVEIIDLTNLAQTGEYRAGGQQQGLSGAREAHPFCQGVISGKITINTDIKFTGPATDVIRAQIPSGSVSGSVCTSCKNNASQKEVRGECSCNEGYFGFIDSIQSGSSKCLTQDECKNKGYVIGADGKKCIPKP